MMMLRRKMLLPIIIIIVIIFYYYQLKLKRVQYDYKHSINGCKPVIAEIELNCVAAMQGCHHSLHLI